MNPKDGQFLNNRGWIYLQSGNFKQAEKDYKNAINCWAQIITMQLSQIKKLKMFNKSLDDYSLETVKQFFIDAKSSGYKL